MFGHSDIPPGFVPDPSRGQDGGSGLARAVGHLLVSGFVALSMYLLTDAFSIGIAFLILIGGIVLGAAITVPVLTRRNKHRDAAAHKKD